MMISISYPHTGSEAVVLLLLAPVLPPVEPLVPGGVYREVVVPPGLDVEGGLWNGQAVVGVPVEVRVVECHLELNIFIEWENSFQDYRVTERNSINLIVVD